MYRKLLEHPRFNQPRWLAVWIYLLLRATHRDYETVFDGKVVVLKPGQLITGRDAIAAATGVHPSSVYRVLKTLKTERQIEQLPGAKSSIITVLNWASYQNHEQQNEQQLNSKQAASEHKQQEEQQNSMIKMAGMVGATPTAARPSSSEQWIRDLKDNPAYQGIDVSLEFHKMTAWCKAHGKQPSPRRFIAWLNRCDRPLSCSPAAAPDHSKGF